MGGAPEATSRVDTFAVARSPVAGPGRLRYNDHRAPEMGTRFGMAIPEPNPHAPHPPRRGY